MTTIQIKRFDETGLTPEDKGTAGDLAYGELAINTTDNRMWVGHSDSSVKEITQQIIFAYWDPDDEVTHPQPTPLYEGQLWYNENVTNGEGAGKLFIAVYNVGLVWISVDGANAGATNIKYLKDLWDVNVVGATAGDVLIHNGSFWENKSGDIESLPNVDADQSNDTKATHGQVLMYDDWKEKWTPHNSPYDGAVLTPHTHYCIGSGFGSSSESFPTESPVNPRNLHQYNDTAFCIGFLSFYENGSTNLNSYNLTQSSIDQGWTDVDVPIVNNPDDGILRYIKIVKKFIGSHNSYSTAASVTKTGQTWSTDRYGFQVRGNAALEVVKSEWLPVPVGTTDPVNVTMVNDANILVVKRYTIVGRNAGLVLTGDNFVAALPSAYALLDEDWVNAGFLTKNPYPRSSSSVVTITPQSSPAWVGGYELMAIQLRVTQGIDESEIAGNPAFDFLTGASDQDVLVYNGGTDTWGPVNKPPLGNNALEEIGDVDVTGVVDGDVLAWDSANTDWKPYSIPVIPDHYIEKQYNFSGPIEVNNGVLRYYLPADISEIRVTPYLVAPSTNGRVGAYLKYDGISIAFAVLQTGETVGEETVITGTYIKGKYLTVEITDAGTDAQTLSLLISLKRA